MAKGKTKQDEVVNEVNVEVTQINEIEPVNVQDEPLNEPVLEVTEGLDNPEVVETIEENLEVVEDVVDDVENDVINDVENDEEIQEVGNDKSASIQIIELTQRYVVYSKNGKKLKKGLTRIQHKEVVNGNYSAL